MNELWRKIEECKAIHSAIHIINDRFLVNFGGGIMHLIFANERTIYEYYKPTEAVKRYNIINDNVSEASEYKKEQVHSLFLSMVPRIIDELDNRIYMDQFNMITYSEK